MFWRRNTCAFKILPVTKIERFVHLSLLSLGEAEVYMAALITDRHHLSKSATRVGSIYVYICNISLC